MTALNSNRTLEIESPHSLPFLSSAFPLSSSPFPLPGSPLSFLPLPSGQPSGEAFIYFFFLNQIDLMAALGLLITPA